MSFPRKSIFFIALSLLLLGIYGVVVFADENSGGYTPGESLNPTCAPGTADCLVLLTGTIAIGDTVTDGTARRMLFIDDSGNLADITSDNMRLEVEAEDDMTAYVSSDFGGRFLVRDDVSGNSALVARPGINGTLLTIDDSTQTIDGFAAETVTFGSLGDTAMQINVAGDEIAFQTDGEFNVTGTGVDNDLITADFTSQSVFLGDHDGGIGNDTTLTVDDTNRTIVSSTMQLGIGSQIGVSATSVGLEYSDGTDTWSWFASDDAGGSLGIEANGTIWTWPNSNGNDGDVLTLSGVGPGVGTLGWETPTGSPITIGTSGDTLYSSGLTGTGQGDTFNGNNIILGENAGNSASNVYYSNFFGNNAGNNADDASNSNFFGASAGQSATDASYSNFIGSNTGYGAARSDHSNFVGQYAGFFATDAPFSNFIGASAGQGAAYSTRSNFIGYNAGQYNGSAGSEYANNSIFIGTNAGFKSGDLGLDNSTAGYSSILIGDESSTGGFENSIAIGYGATNTISGEFLVDDDYDYFNFNGARYLMPSDNGDTNEVLTVTDADGTLSWEPAGGSSALTDTYIGYGSVGNTLTGTSDMTWDDAAKTFRVGDVGGAINGNIFSLIDATSTFQMTSTLGQVGYFNADIFTVQLGDTGNAVNGTVFTILDNTQTLSMANTSGSVFSANAGNYNVSIGDVDNSVNGTKFTVNGTGNSISGTATDGVDGTSIGLASAGGNLIFSGGNTSNLAVSSSDTTLSWMSSGGLSVSGISAGLGFLDLTNNDGNDNTVTWHWPTIDGDSDFLLGTDGSGNLDWYDPALVPSDQRLKSNISDLSSDTLSNLLQVKTVSYILNNDEEERIRIGFIAQDLEQYFPELVGERNDGYKGVYYAQMTPVLVEAIRELDLKIDEIENFENQTFKDKFIAWFGDVTNGIQKIFTKEVQTEKLCIGTGDDIECIESAQELRDIKASLGIDLTPTPDSSEEESVVEDDGDTESGDAPDEVTDTPEDETPVEDPAIEEVVVEESPLEEVPPEESVSDVPEEESSPEPESVPEPAV